MRNRARPASAPSRRPAAGAGGKSGSELRQPAKPRRLASDRTRRDRPAARGRMTRTGTLADTDRRKRPRGASDRRASKPMTIPSPQSNRSYTRSVFARASAASTGSSTITHAARSMSGWWEDAPAISERILTMGEILSSLANPCGNVVWQDNDLSTRFRLGPSRIPKGGPHFRGLRPLKAPRRRQLDHTEKHAGFAKPARGVSLPLPGKPLVKKKGPAIAGISEIAAGFEPGTFRFSPGARTMRQAAGRADSKLCCLLLP